MREERKYFLKDEAITLREEDYFKHEDIADNIVNVINTQNTPYNIALIGKWGTGKSSIVELVKRKLSNPQKYKFAEINAWKYEKEELRRTLLKQVFEAVDGKKEKEIIKEQLDSFTNTTIKEEQSEIKTKGQGKLARIFSKLWRMLKPLLKLGIQTLAVFIIITIIYFGFYFIVSIIKGEKIKITECIMLYMQSDFVSKIAISILTPIIKEFIETYRVKGFNFWKVMYPKTGTDEYEELLKSHLKSFKKRVIVIIDDIDRLTTPKIVEALDAIKAFAEFRKIIFIVPFDDSVLKKALEASEKEYQVDTQMIESELFLDKLFQFKIYMPPLPEYDIREYTHELCKKECTELINICGEDFDEIIDEILIHPNVNNPRQVKKILNNFLNNYLIAKKRDNIKLEQGLLTNNIGIRVIAKLSVLQCDFNEFYDKLVEDFDLEKNFLSFYNDRNEDKKLPDNLKEISEYFERNKLKDKYLPLINYLILTSTIKVDNIAPYIYMAQDKLGIEMGDKKQRKIKEALESKNIVSITEIAKEDLESIQKVVKFQLEINKLNANTLSTIVNCLHLFSEEFLKDICHLLVKKLYRMNVNDKIHDYLEYDIENIMLLYRISNRDNLLNGIIENIIDKVVVDEVSKQSKDKIMGCLLDSEKELTEEIKLTFKFIIERVFASSTENYTIKDFIEQIDINEFDINYYLGTKQYNELCEYIEENEYYNSEGLSLVIELANILIKNKECDECLKSVKEWINIEDLIETMEKIIVNMSCKMSNDISNQIISNINVELLEDKIDNITNIIENLNYQITEENKIIMDKKFTDIEDKKYIVSIIENICKKNQMRFLENLSKNISDQLLEVDEYQPIINDILTSYSSMQLNYINTLIKPLYSSATGVEQENFERAIQISKTLIKNNLLTEEMKRNLKNGIVTIKNYYNHKEWANWMIEIIGENINILTESDIDEYCNLICKLLKDTIYQRFSLKAIEHMLDGLNEENIDIIIETILEQEIDLIGNKDLAKKLMDKTSTNYYPDYISLLVKQINSDNYYEIHDILSKHIENIEEDEYISKLDVLTDNQIKKASYIIGKLNIREKNENEESIIEKLFNNCTDFNKLLIAGNKIFSSIENLNEIQLDKINNEKALNNYLQTMIKYNAEKKKVHEIIIYSLQNVEELYILETIKIIGNIDKKYYPIRREKINISEALYNVFTVTTSSEIKKEICMVIKNLRMRDQFLRKDFNENDKEFLKSL